MLRKVNSSYIQESSLQDAENKNIFEEYYLLGRSQWPYGLKA
jgi:hypothetical protein